MLNAEFHGFDDIKDILCIQRLIASIFFRVYVHVLKTKIQNNASSLTSAFSYFFYNLW